MKAILILTLLGPDRPGLVEALAETIANHKGSWLESRMAKLSGHFTGILRVEVPEESRQALEIDLIQLSAQGLHVTIATDTPSMSPSGERMDLEIVGHDQPGIVKRIATTLAAHGANVEELETTLESAPMAGHLLFRTQGTVCLPENRDASDLMLALEDLGPDLSVTLTAS